MITKLTVIEAEKGNRKRGECDAGQREAGVCGSDALCFGDEHQ